MLVFPFDSRQKEALLTLAYTLVLADNKIRADEGAFLEQLGESLDLGDHVSPGDQDVEVCAEAFKDPESRLAAMLTLLQQSGARRKVDDSEQVFFVRLGRAFGFSERELLMFRHWAQRQAAQLRELSEMMETTRGEPVTWSVSFRKRG